MTGLKQGWAFAWRSLLAGELLVAIAVDAVFSGIERGIRRRRGVVVSV